MSRQALQNPQAQAILYRAENPFVVGDSPAERAAAISGGGSFHAFGAFFAGAGMVRGAAAEAREALSGAGAAEEAGAAEGAAAAVRRGARRGPKPWPEGPHNQTIARRIEELRAEGMTHRGGGQKTEWTFKTPGGYKSSRRLDIVMRRPDGSYHYEQIGEMTADNMPHPRQVEALEDLWRRANIRAHFTPFH